MGWKLALAMGCVLAVGASITVRAQAPAAQPPGQAQAQQAPKPLTLQDLTRILRSSDRADELEGALVELDAMIAAGNADAAQLLGIEYSRDRGSLPLDYAKAVSYLEQAAALGRPEAYMVLADLHRRESGGLPRAKALDYLRAAAYAGLEQALMPLAEALRRGIYGEPDVPASIPYYEAALAAGNTAAARQLTAIYRAGTGGPDDGAMLARYLGITADTGDNPARRALADLYLKGVAVPSDPALAERYLRAALADGDEAAGPILATALLRGQLGAGREAEAVPLLQAAFDAGNIAVAAPLADAYARGRGVTADLPKAIGILRAGADGDDAAAKAALLNLYVRGSGRDLPPNPAAARSLYAAIPDHARTPAILANGAILAAHGRSLDDYALMWTRFKELDATQQARAGQQILRINRNAYVYMLQSLLAERGHYSGAMSGLLTASTISAVNAFCVQLNIARQCRLGPLNRGTWDAIAAGLES